MNDLRVTALQTPLVWENADANRKNIAELISNMPATDVLALPEMFTTGFSMNAEQIAEPFQEHGMATLEWMREQAAKHQCVVTGSVAVKEEGKYFNRLLWVRPDGSFSHYNKRHLFRMAHEHQHYTPGAARTVEEVKGWKVLPLICYDLRFPELSRNSWKDGSAEFDVLFYVANWPEVRRHPWSSLLIARAIENQSYLVGVNCSGTDGNGIQYTGDSVILDARGQVLSAATPGETQLITATLSRGALEDFREKFPVLLDRVEG
jgi:omega-amidase